MTSSYAASLGSGALGGIGRHLPSYRLAGTLFDGPGPTADV